MTIEFRKFTDSSLADTETAWMGTASSLGIPCIDYETIISWAKGKIDYSVKDGSCAYGVFEENDDEALAIVDIIHTQLAAGEAGRLKMLRVSLGPTYEANEIINNPSLLTKVTDIYAEATLGTIKLSGDHGSRTVKIYGRDGNLLALLNALNERIKASDLPNAHTRMEGRWFVISTH